MVNRGRWAFRREGKGWVVNIARRGFGWGEGLVVDEGVDDDDAASADDDWDSRARVVLFKPIVMCFVRGGAGGMGDFV